MSRQGFRRTYRFGESQLALEFGNITSSKAEVIVSSDDCFLSMGGGVSAAISEAAGQAILADVAKQTPAKLGDVVVTSAGNLPAKFIFHAVTIGMDYMPASDPRQQVQDLTTRCLQLCRELGLREIAFPALGAGVAGFSYDEVAVSMAEVIAAELKKEKAPLTVTIYLFDRFGQVDPIDFIPFFEEFGARMREFGSVSAPETAEEEARGESQEICANEDSADRSRLRKELTALGKRRDDLEKRLVLLKGGLSREEKRQISDELSEITGKRSRLLQRLHEPTLQDIEVFISYSHVDERFRLSLGKHLMALERQKIVSIWHDRKISPGSAFEGEIEERLENSSLILLLVSADFIASEFCFTKEMQRALARHDDGEALVVPIILRPVDISGLPFEKLLFLPEDGKAVTLWQDEDLAWMNVVEGIRKSIDQWQVQTR